MKSSRAPSNGSSSWVSRDRLDFEGLPLLNSRSDSLSVPLDGLGAGDADSDTDTDFIVAFRPGERKEASVPIIPVPIRRFRGVGESRGVPVVDLDLAGVPKTFESSCESVRMRSTSSVPFIASSRYSVDRSAERR